MDEDDAVEEGLDLSLFAVRSLVTTADFGCGMKEPVCGEPDRELLQLVDVLGAAMPEGPLGLLICLLCTTAAMSFLFFCSPLTIHKHQNNSSEARRPSCPEGCKLKLARRLSSPRRRDVTSDDHPVPATYGVGRSVRVDTEVGFASDGHKSEMRASVAICRGFR